MASGPQTFTILGVFSSEHFRGNRLAIVAVRSNVLSQATKALIAREFGFAGTVFVYDAPSVGIPRRIDMFSDRGEELPFSGHCVIGTAHYVFQRCEPLPTTDREKPQTTVLMTKVGPVSVLYNPQRLVAMCSVPQTFTIHQTRMSFEEVLKVQPHLQIVPIFEKCKTNTYPVVSLVKGMSFSLVDLTLVSEIFAALTPGRPVKVELDAGQESGYIGVMYYKRKTALTEAGEPSINSIQARVFANGVEDSGNGSACAALACYLAMNEDTIDASSHGTNNKPGETAEKSKEKVPEAPKVHKHVYAIQQGAEVGKACTIAVEIDILVDENDSKKVKSVTISGRASFFASGELSRF